jgi:DMSO/TMAO reductase YedYZ molybdopterin-dependent catalytic subunit
VLASAGCVRSRTVTDPGTGQPVDLGATEVREYRGEKLGSAADFRENSIKGPQRVNREGYSLVVAGMVETPLAFSYDQVLDRPLYEKVVTLFCVEGWNVKILWEGVRIADLLAHRMNGLDLPPERGFPFQVVAEDRWGYKWAKWVTGIEVSEDVDYRGYWESRGYDDATLPARR